MATSAPWHLTIKRDTSAQWALKNPILEDEVIGYERDTKKFKIGNGISPWSVLPYGNITGPTGLLVFISQDANNRLKEGTDGGLYVPELTLDLQALYMLSKA